MMWLSKDELSG